MVSPSSAPPTTERASKDPNAPYKPAYLQDQNDPPNNFAEVAAEIEATLAEAKARELAISTAKLAFVPPALILLVGLSLTWAFRGFRPS